MAHLSFHQNHHGGSLWGQGMNIDIKSQPRADTVTRYGVLYTIGEYKACIKLNSQKRRSSGDINSKYQVKMRKSSHYSLFKITLVLPGSEDSPFSPGGALFT
jgi:hypothetical protein